MKLRKAIKKVAAVGTGAAMVGATLFGASATDLAEYPSPLFIKDGKFDGIIVVGEGAAAQDVVGAIDIATSLQFESKTQTTVSVTGASATTVVEGDAVKLSKSSDALNFGEALNEPIQSLTDDDLGALMSGSVKNEQGTFDFNQFLDMPGGASVVHEVDDDQSDDPALYLKFPDTTQVYKYTLNFPTALETDLEQIGSTSRYELDDLEDKKIVLLGKEYSIQKAELTAGGEQDLVLELLSGALQDTLEEYTSKTYTVNGVDYDVEVIAISDVPEVILKVNGETTEKLGEGDTYTLNDGTEIGIKTLLENEGTETGGGDVVEFYLGASKITLTEDNWATSTSGTIEVAEETVDATVNFEGTNTSSKLELNEIEIEWTAEEDYFVPVGGKLSEQLPSDEVGNLFLQNVDFEFASADFGAATDIELKPSGDNIRMTMTTKTGGEFSFDAFHLEGSTRMGVGEDVGTSGNPGTDVFVVDDDVGLVKNNYVALSEDEFSYVMQVDKFEDNDEQVWFKDIATGEIIKVSSAGCATSASTGELKVDGKTFDFTASCSGTGDYVNFTDFGSDYTTYSVTNGSLLFNKDEAMIVFGMDDGNNVGATANGFVHLFEEESDDFTFPDYTNAVRVPIDAYSADEPGVNTPVAVDGAGSGDPFNQSVNLVDWDSKDNWETGITQYGTQIEYDSDEQGEVKLMYPADEAAYSIYVSSGTTTSTTVGGADEGDFMSTSVNPITVGAAKLDTEVTNVAAQNMIVVGGPCANQVAAALMGNPAVCNEGFQEGKAIIKLFENGGKVAMLVAGETALDTRRATRVLADYESYSLSGMEVEVRGTSTTFSDTVVSQPTPMMEEEEEEMMDEDMQ